MRPGNMTYQENARLRDASAILSTRAEFSNGYRIVDAEWVEGAGNRYWVTRVRTEAGMFAVSFHSFAIRMVQPIQVTVH